MAWYHWIAAYMIIIPVFLIAVMPESFFGVGIWIVIGSIIGALAIIKFAPWGDDM